MDQKHQLLQRFKRDLFDLGRSESTVSSYLSAVSAFLDFAGVKAEYTRRDILDFLNNLKISETSKATYVEAIKTFFKLNDLTWPFKKGELKLTSSAEIPPPTSLVLAREELQKFAQCCQSLNPRDRAILYTLIWTGMRRGELCKLNREDFQPPYLFIRMLKGEKYRTVLLHEKVIRAIEDYLKQRRDRNPSLFLGPGGERVTPSYVTRLVKKVLSACGLNRPGAGAHVLRRTLATLLVEANQHPVVIQEYMGWESPKMVSRYARLRPSVLAESIYKVHPFASA